MIHGTIGFSKGAGCHMYVIIVEEDPRQGMAMKRAFEQMACTVLWINAGNSPLEALRQPDADLVVIALPEPVDTGLLRDARRTGVRTPILVIVACDSARARIDALDAGADDCLATPFDLDELTARARCLARRHGGQADNGMQAGPIHMDIGRLEVSLDGRRVELTRREFAVLRALMCRPGRIVQRDVIERSVYGCDSEVGSNALEVLVHSLRRKLGQEAIGTVRGFGYMVRK